MTETTKNQGWGEIPTFIVNPAFLADINTREIYDKLDHETLVEYCIKKDRRIKRICRSRDNAISKCEEYKKEIQALQERNKGQRKDNKYQEDTLYLYKNILTKLVMPNANTN